MDLDSPRLRVRPAESGLVLEGRWKILPDPFVFEDENYTIFSGLDVKQSTRVAIKVYQGSDVVTWRKFRRSIDFQLTLRSRFSDDGGRLEPSVPLEKLLEELKARMSLTDFPAARLFLTKMNLRECFADLISFSHDSNWNPALDPETGLFFAILECPPEAISLQQRLDVCRMAKEPMSIEEVLQIQWALISMVLGLNAEGLVHLEMDPSRIIAFQKNGKTLWKLMDFDPILCAGTHIRPQELPSYEWYAPPEIAKVFLRGPRDGERVAITTGLMVFSAGMCMLDVSTHLACHDDAGLCWRLKWDQKHPGKSPIALAGENSVRATTSLPVIPQECLEMLRRTNMDLGRLLEAMLSRNPEKRIHIGQCVMHPWFEPKRSAIFYAKWSMPDEPPVPGTTGPGSPPPTLHFPTEQHGPTTTTATAAMTTMSQKNSRGHNSLAGATATASEAAAATLTTANPMRRPNQTFDEKEDLPITFNDLRAYIKAQIALGEEERAAEEEGARQQRGFNRGKSLQLHGAAAAMVARDVEVALEASPSAGADLGASSGAKERPQEKKQGCILQ